MGDKENNVKVIGLSFTEIAVPPGYARSGQARPKLNTATTKSTSHGPAVETQAATIVTEPINDSTLAITNDSMVTEPQATINPTQITAHKSRPKISLASSKLANTASETAQSTPPPTQPQIPESKPTDAGIDSPVKASAAKPRLSLKGTQNSAPAKPTIAEQSVASIPTESTPAEKTEAPTSDVVQTPGSSLESTTDPLESSSTETDISEKIAAKQFEKNTEQRVDSRHITQYIHRHGTSAWAVLQPIGRAGVRITLVAEDGILGDQVVPNMAIAHDLVSGLAELTESEWTRALVSKTTISPQHWLKMAGWVARSHHFPKFKSRST